MNPEVIRGGDMSGPGSYYKKDGRWVPCSPSRVDSMFFPAGPPPPVDPEYSKLEVIVRALAAGDEPTADSVLPQLCTLCDATYGPLSAAIAHEPTCPWRMAREWVAAQSQEPEGDPIGQPAGELQELADPEPRWMTPELAKRFNEASVDDEWHEVDIDSLPGEDAET